MNELKERLRNYKNIKAKAYEYRMKIEDLEDDLGPGAIGYEEKGGHTNKISRTTEDAAIRIAEKKELLNNILKVHTREISRIENALSVLTVNERQAIEMKYMEQYSIETIMYKLDKSKRTVLYYIGDALKKMKDVLG